MEENNKPHLFTFVHFVVKQLVCTHVFPAISETAHYKYNRETEKHKAVDDQGYYNSDLNTFKKSWLHSPACWGNATKQVGLGLQLERHL